MSSNQTVDVIQAFYDKHPYPPPVADLERDRQQWEDSQRRRADHHLLSPATPYRGDEAILVAGCGTTQAARYAVRFPSARVTAIDISPASLDSTRALQRRHGLANLELHELSVEQAPDLGCTFDRVVCTGVLHHLLDPDTGLRALREVLAPSGAAHLMVYAPYGRAGIYMLQEYCRRLGVGDTDQELRDLTAVLKALPRHHPLTPLLQESPDFERPDALADALLNPRDRAYSVPELLDLLQRNGLAFGRWYRQAPYRPQCGDLSRTPHGRRLAKLPEPEAYAAVELFRGAFARHSVIAYRDDAPPGTGVVSFDDDGYQQAVPLRMPHTLCLEERLPPGAAAVLLNQGHPYPDLFLPVRAREKRLFDVIDGHRTIGEIARRASFDLGAPVQRQRVKTFFEQLWCYDQVVFDLSAPADRSAAPSREARVPS